MGLQIQEIDGYVLSQLKTKEWYCQFQHCFTGGRFDGFTRHLIYVITEFLAQKGDNDRELFIELPVEELGGDEGERFSKIIEVAYHCAILITATSLKKKCLVPQNTWYRHENQSLCLSCELDDCFYAVHEQEDVILKCSRKKDQDGKPLGKKIIKYYDCRGKEYYIAKNEYNLSSNFFDLCRITKYPAQFNCGVEKIKEELRCLKRLCEAFPRQFDSVSIRTMSSYVPHVGDYLPKTVCFEDENDEIEASVLFLIGDDAYKSGIQRYRNSVAEKIIVIGSSDVDLTNKYSFSFREMYHYCATNENQIYHEPRCVELDFPWLREIYNSLSMLLNELSQDDEYLQNEHNRRILTFRLLYPFLDLNFTPSQLQEMKNTSQERVDEITQNCSLNSYEKILTWYRSISFDGVNPKMEYAQRTSCNLIVPRYTSYSRKLRALDGDLYTILLDGAKFAFTTEYYKNINGREYPDVKGGAISYILRYKKFSKIQSLCYAGFEKHIADSFKKIPKIERYRFSSPFREMIGTAVLLPENENESKTNSTVLLEDDIQLLPPSFYSRKVVAFADGSFEVIDGCVLKKTGGEWKMIDVDELISGDHIMYYRQPDSFEKFFVGYYQSNIDKYANLWKSRFREYAIHNSLATRQLITRGVPESVVNTYIEGSDNRFIRRNDHMNIVLQTLVEVGSISIEEKNMIENAREEYYKTSSFGKNLKDELLNYACNNHSDTSIINKLIERRVVSSIDEVVVASLHENIVKDVETRNY